MNNFLLYITLFLLSYPCALFAAAFNFDDMDDAMKLCPQLFVGNYSGADAKYNGSVENCRKVWDQYAQTKNYCGLAIMSFRGEGGQTPSVTNAIKYAKKLTNSVRQETNAGCSKNILLSYLNTFLKEEPNTVNYESLTINTHELSSADIGGINAQHDLTIRQYYTEQKVNAFIKRLPKEQEKEFSIVWKNYQNFVDSYDNAYPQPCNPNALSGVLGSENVRRYGIDDYNVVVEDFQNVVKNFEQPSVIAATPSPTSVAALDNQLNVAYKKLINTEKRMAINHKNMILLERSWVKYKESYINFAKLYYNGRISPNEITLSATASLTKRQLDVLNNLIDLLDEPKNKSFDEPDYKPLWEGCRS